MEVAQGVFHFDTGPFNWYVIRDEGRLTVVDAGFPGHYGALLDGLSSIGSGLGDIEGILITHAHADHLGFAERLRTVTNKPAYVHAADASAAKRALQLPWGGLLGNAWRPYVGSLLARAVANGVFRMPRLEHVVPVADGDVLDVPGRPTVMHTPGHTAGEVVFYLPQRQVVIAGDALVTRDLMSGRIGHPQVPTRSLSHDHDAALGSLDRLSDLGHVTVLPGHGTPWEGEIADAIDLARGSEGYASEP